MLTSICECIKCLCKCLSLIEDMLKCECCCDAEEWEDDKEYKVGDKVKFSGVVYICTYNNHSSASNQPPNQQYWR